MTRSSVAQIMATQSCGHGTRPRLMVLATDRPMLITGGTSAWWNRHFVRWWDVILATICIFGTGIIALSVNDFFVEMYYRDASPLALARVNPWVFAASGGAITLVSYAFFILPTHYVIEIFLTRGRLSSAISGLESPFMQDAEHTPLRREIAEAFLRPHRNRNLGGAVREYDGLHAKAGITEHRASLLIEEGRCRRWWTERVPPRLDMLTDRAFATAVPGEVEPVVLPIRFRFLGVLFPLAVLHNMLWSPVQTAFLRATVWTTAVKVPEVASMDASSIGIGLAATIIIGYVGLRELGIFPLPLFRGECSAEKTRVFHRFRWKTFRPGRDLAILRFTSNQEADIAFLGADGSHATARVGGKYLDHFIACWAAPR